ncbi:serine/threonine protein kinase [Planctomycetaceae bacterium SH139]
MTQFEPQIRSIFREAALRSGLVSVELWETVAAKVASQAAGKSAEWVDETVAKRLVQSGHLTPYQAAQLQSGRTKLNLGPYIITDWIAQGGMGQVFKAVHNVMGRESAVKVLPLEKATEEARKGFLHEIRLQAGLDCQYLVRAYDAGQDGNVHYLVTEYVPGTDLRRLVRQRGMLSQAEAAVVIMQAALGLDYAHRQGLIHRDVKPGNLLVTPDGQTKVSDVGLAAWATALGDDPRAGKIVGTADYLSPEQIRSPRDVGPATDIYSLGCTLYYAICGKVPFPGGDTSSKCRRHCEETPWHPRKFAPDCSEEFVELIADMMEKDPGRRISTAAEVAERLEPWAEEVAGPVQRPLVRRAWTAPPPPADDAGPPLPASPWGEASDSDGSQGSDREPPATVLPSSNPATANFPAANFGAAGTGLPGVPSLSGSSPDDPGSPKPPAAAHLPDWQTASSVAAAVRPNSLSGRQVWARIAISLAIAIPLAMLVGALLGFFIRDYIE